MRSEFLSLKYIGVPTVAELIENADFYGWKCRKYSGWKQVHVERGDASLLHQMASSLIDKGQVDCAVYGRMSEIWLRVQRWRLDKKKLQIEPARKDAWEKVKVGIHVALQYPRSIVSFLYSRDVKKELSSYDGSMLFLLHHLLDFLQDVGISPTGDLSGAVRGETLSKNSLDHAAVILVDQLYDEQCANIENMASGIDLLNQVLKDLEIDAFVPPVHLPYTEVILDDEPSVIVEYSTLEKDKVIDIKMIKGRTIVVLNKNHIGLNNIMQVSGHYATEIIFAAMGATVNDMSSKGRVLDDFLALFSLHLIQLSSNGVLSGQVGVLNSLDEKD